MSLPLINKVTNPSTLHCSFAIYALQRVQLGGCGLQSESGVWNSSLIEAL